MDPRISRIRSFQNLGDTDQFPHNTVANIWFQTVWRPQVNGAAEQLLKMVLQSEQTKVTDWPIEFDEQVNIAGRRCLVMCNRAK